MFNTRHGVFRARRLAAYSYARPTRHNKERANLSFLLVLMFFGVFGVVVLTEIFMVDERGRGQGVVVRHGAPTRQRTADARPDYEDPFIPVSGTRRVGRVREGPGGSGRVKDHRPAVGDVRSCPFQNPDCVAFQPTNQS